MKSYSVIFSTPLTRGDNLKNRVIAVRAMDAAAAARQIEASYQGVQILAVMGDVDNIDAGLVARARQLRDQEAQIDARAARIRAEAVRRCAGLVEVVRQGPPPVVGFERGGQRQADFDKGWLAAKDQIWAELVALGVAPKAGE